MNLHEFNQEVVQVTIKDLGNDIANKSHMLLGITSEILDELFVSAMQDDITNYFEEIGDTEWFTIGYMNFYGLSIPIDTPDKSEFILEFFKSRSNESNMQFFEDQDNNNLSMMFINSAIGILSSILKKEITSGVLKYNGEIVEKQFLQDLTEGILYSLSQLAEKPDDYHDFTFAQSMTMSEIREKIKNKLLFRHKGQAMTVETDLNRDLTSERTILEK